MNRFKRPHIWFLLSLLLIAGGGAVWLAQPACTQLTERDWQFYWARHYWMCALDGLSAACGAGFLHYDFNAAYTDQGRWALTLIGLAGALLYLMATLQAFRRLRLNDAARGGPPVLSVVVLFLLLQGVCVPLLWGVERLAGASLSFSDATWRATAAFSSLGWVPGAGSSVTPAMDTGANIGAHRWPDAWIALLTALGWPLWFLCRPKLRRQFVPFKPLVLRLTTYLLGLIFGALLILALETPRGRGFDLSRPRIAEATPAPSMSAVAAQERFSRSLRQTISAAAAGQPTENIKERGVSEGTKFMLALLLLTGGLSGSPTGGLQSLLLAAACGGVWLLWRNPRQPIDPDAQLFPTPARRLWHAGVVGVLLMVGVTAVVALGLLFIETNVVSAFQSPSTFADAFLDAASAVGGGNLSSGLIAAVTDENLSSGMAQRVDLYQYGTVWIMLALVVGRVLPLFVLVRAGEQSKAEEAPRE